MPRLKPFHLGLVQWLAAVSFLAAFLTFAFPNLTYPSPNLMQATAQIGATILLGWIVEAAWMTTRLQRKSEDERENWLGSTLGLGLGGFLGLVVALLVSEHRTAGHANFLDLLGLWWSVIAIGSLGIMVTLHPVIVDRWTEKDRTPPAPTVSEPPVDSAE